MANIDSSFRSYSTAEKSSPYASSLNSQEQIDKKLAEARASMEALGWDSKKTEETLKKIQKNLEKENEKHLKKIETELLKTTGKVGDKIKSAFKEAFSDDRTFGKSLSDMASKAANAFASGVDRYIGVYASHMSSIATRLQGFGRTYEQMSSTIASNLAGSPFVKQTEVLENLSKFVDQGLTQDIEQRAFLASVSDRIAKTFNAFDSSLISIIKIQQEDSTVARLGLESSLNKFLNQTFGDTSYLSQLSTSVRTALLQAESQLGVAQSTQVQYDIEKWLGALSALGLSSSAITTIGQGLGYLGSGNISALTSNTSLQNLLLMSAQKGGVDYSSLLTGGLTSSSINNLFSGLIAIGQQMNQESNLVLKNQLANLLGLSISDLTAIGNLNQSQYSSLLKSSLTYSGMVDETVAGLNTISQRTSMKDMITNVFDNMMARSGEIIANNATLYGTYLASDFIQKMGDISIFGTKAASLVKTALVGGTSLFSIGESIANLFSNSIGDLGDWGKGLDAESIKQRGGRTSSGNLLSTSISIKTRGSSSGGVYDNAITNASEVEETITSAQEQSDTISDIKDILEKNIDDKLGNIIEILSTTGIVIRNTQTYLFSTPDSNNSTFEV